MEKKSLQFELWQECGSNCTYCYLGSENRFTSAELKLDAIAKAYTFIKTPEKLKGYNVISYIGGEFFQGQLNTPEVKSAFCELIRYTGELHATGKINEIWLMATMTIGDQHELYECIDLLQNEYKKVNKPELIENVWIVTSYDTIGRFHTEKMLNTWKNSINTLHKKYNGIKINVCTILTQDLITKYINDEFSFTNFRNEFKNEFFFKQPSPGNVDALIPRDITDPMDRQRAGKVLMEKRLQNFFPQRNDFLMFLIKLKSENPELYEKLFNIKFRADDLYRNYNTTANRMEHNHREKETKAEASGDVVAAINNCGHQINYCCYIDSDECALCDRLAIGD